MVFPFDFITIGLSYIGGEIIITNLLLLIYVKVSYFILKKRRKYKLMIKRRVILDESSPYYIPSFIEYRDAVYARFRFVRKHFWRILRAYIALKINI